MAAGGCGNWFRGSKIDGKCNRVVGAYGIKILTKIRVHVRDYMPKI